MPRHVGVGDIPVDGSIRSRLTETLVDPVL